jgi:hypothetical protein
MKAEKEIKQQINNLRKEYRNLNKEFPESDILVDQLKACLADQVRILKWVLEK